MNLGCRDVFNAKEAIVGREASSTLCMKNVVFNSLACTWNCVSCGEDEFALNHLHRLLSRFSCDISYLGSVVRNGSVLPNDPW